MVVGGWHVSPSPSFPAYDIPEGKEFPKLDNCYKATVYVLSSQEKEKAMW